jgi:hypothetical protein
MGIASARQLRIEEIIIGGRRTKLLVGTSSHAQAMIQYMDILRRLLF